MKNKYLSNLSKIEFVVTDACTGKCKHCSEGEHALCGESINAEKAAEVVRKISSLYEIKTVMAFGGEPLLCPASVYAVMTAAKEENIEKRQVITNGYFSKDKAKIKEVAEKLAECGVNDLLLSVDAFHEETIPLSVVKIFAAEAKNCGIPMRLQPAWLVAREDKNPYNEKTREILKELEDMQIPIGDGNVIFPEGNAKKYLAEYFTDTLPENPYIEDRSCVRCVSVSANGDALDGNIYKTDILDIIKNYKP